MGQLTANQVECLEDAEDRLTQAYGALTSFNAALKTATEFNVMPQDLYSLLFPIQSEVLAALNDIQVLHGK